MTSEKFSGKEQETHMKLNNKRTILIGFAFLAISTFWQVYDNIIPLILKYLWRGGAVLRGGGRHHGAG